LNLYVYSRFYVENIGTPSPSATSPRIPTAPLPIPTTIPSFCPQDADRMPCTYRHSNPGAVPSSTEPPPTTPSFPNRDSQAVAPQPSPRRHCLCSSPATPHSCEIASETRQATKSKSGGVDPDSWVPDINGRNAFDAECWCFPARRGS
jgi:hypothetical protein